MSRPNRKALALALSFALFGGLLFGCSGKAERQAKYLQRAQEYFDQGNFDKARIEAKNVLQIDANNAEARYVFAQIAEQEANWQQMYSELHAALETDPKMLKARVKLAQLFVLVNQLDRANEELTKIKEQAPNSADFYAVAAGIAAREKSTDEAVKNAEQALAIQPGHLAATALLTSIYSNSDPAKAEQVIASGIQLNPTHDELRLLQVRLYAQEKKVDAAIAGMQELIKRNPDQLAYVSQLSKYYVQQGRAADAEALLRKTVADKPENADLKLVLVDFVAKQQGAEAALAQLNKFVAAEPENYKLRAALANLYVLTKSPERAIATYQYTIDKDVKGEGLDARNRVVEILLGQNKRKEAEALLKDILALEPGNADGLLTRARLEMADNNVDAAITDLRSILKDSPDSANALLLLASAQERTGAATLALDSYKRVLESNGNNLPALVGAARLDMAGNQLDEAAKYLEHARSLDPANVDVDRFLVELHVRKKEFKPALEICEELIQGRNPAMGHYLKGLIFLEEKEPAAAIESLKIALEKEPRAIEPLQALVTTYLGTKQVAAAIDYLEGHTQAHPDQLHAQEMLGSLYRQTGKSQQAEAVLSPLVDKQPVRVGAYRELMAVYAAQKQPEKVAALLEEGRRRTPDNVDIMVLQAQFMYSRADYEKALALYEQAIKLQPKSDLIKNNLAQLLAEHFPSDENLRRAQALTANFADSKNPVLIDTLAWVQFKLTNYPQTISLLESVIGKAQDMPELHYHLGMAYLKSGARDKAKSELTKATASKADFPGRDAALAELKKL